MTTRLPAQCWACARRAEDSVDARCQAFPDGIPFEIIGLGQDHRSPVPGDNGLQFLQADTDAARTAFTDWKRYHAAATADDGE